MKELLGQKFSSESMINIEPRAPSRQNDDLIFNNITKLPGPAQFLQKKVRSCLTYKKLTN